VCWDFNDEAGAFETTLTALSFGVVWLKMSFAVAE
jgi:hypothetical protein